MKTVINFLASIVFGIITMIAALAVISFILWTSDVPYVGQCIARGIGFVALLFMFYVLDTKDE